MTEPYRFYYWPSIPGRGELVRLVLEELDLPYVDVGRQPEDEGGGAAAVAAMRKDDAPGFPGFAPPYLVTGSLVLSQTAVICDFLASRHDLGPQDEAGRARALQLQLCVEDVFTEVHATHHPIATGLFYEAQREPAEEAAAHFRQQRMPVWLDYFQRVLQRSTGEWLTGERMCPADLSLFQLLRGLAHAFPLRFSVLALRYPELLDLSDRVQHRPRIASYLASDRRIPFNRSGIFRNYPELDGD